MRVVHRSATGEKYFKRVLCKIFAPGKKKPAQHMYRAQPGRLLSPQNVDGILAALSEQIENVWFPGHAYRFVTVGAGEFNFVHEDECSACASSTGAAETESTSHSSAISRAS